VGQKFMFLGLENITPHWVPVAHAYNPSYSGSRDQEDRCSKPARAKICEKILLTNKRLME
jgi:hypothetical protein